MIRGIGQFMGWYSGAQNTEICTSILICPFLSVLRSRVHKGGEGRGEVTGDHLLSSEQQNLRGTGGGREGEFYAQIQ